MSELIYLFAYDLSKKLDSSKVRNIFKGAEDFSSYEHEKAIPEEIATFNIPTIFNLKAAEITFGSTKLAVKREVSIYEIGAFSVRIRVQVPGANAALLEDLTFDQDFNNSIKSIASDVKQRTEKALQKAADATIKDAFETYRIYVIDADKESFYSKNKRLIAGLLLEDKNYANISESYLRSTISKRISYYKSEIAVIDWDATVFITESKNYEHELLIAEIANIQLLEFRAYHDDISKRIKTVNERFSSTVKSNPFKIFGARKNLARLSLEIGEFYDETKDMVNSANNIVYGFGEWYLAKLYSLFSESFRLQSWYNSLSENLEMLEKIRSFVEDMVQEETNYLLEVIIIVLIVVEVVVEFLWLTRL
ncbi:MAG: hypothetical protein QW774_00435 [Candidatus Micrarchaeaceae archaeon]